MLNFKSKLIRKSYHRFCFVLWNIFLWNGIRINTHKNPTFEHTTAKSYHIDLCEIVLRMGAKETERRIWKLASYVRLCVVLYAVLFLFHALFEKKRKNDELLIRLRALVFIFIVAFCFPSFLHSKIEIDGWYFFTSISHPSRFLSLSVYVCVCLCAGAELTSVNYVIHSFDSVHSIVFLHLSVRFLFFMRAFTFYTFFDFIKHSFWLEGGGVQAPTVLFQFDRSTSTN